MRRASSVILWVSVLLLGAQQASAAFNPTNYAVYQFSKNTSDGPSRLEGIMMRRTTLVAPLVSNGWTGSILLDEDLTGDKALSNAEHRDYWWPRGANWLVAEADSSCRTFRLGLDNDWQRGGARARAHYNLGAQTVTTYATTFHLEDTAKLTPNTDLFAYRHYVDTIRYFNAVGGFSMQMNQSTDARIDSIGQLHIYRYGLPTSQGGEPMANDTIGVYQLRPGIGYALLIECTVVSDTSYRFRLYLNDSCLADVENPSIAYNPMYHPAPTYVAPHEEGYLFLYSAGGGALVAGDLAIYDQPATDVYESTMAWETDPDVPVDTLYVPCMINQIVYDPPGDASVATIASGSTIGHAVSFGLSTEVGAYLQAGVSLPQGCETGYSGVEVDIKGGLTFNYDMEATWESSLSLSTELSSSTEGGLVEYMGPARGDMVSYAPVDVERTFIRRPMINAVNPDPSDRSHYGNAMLTRILPDTATGVQFSTMAALTEQSKDDSLMLAILQRESAVDLVTGRVRQELVDNGRLVRLSVNPVVEFTGNGDVTFSQTNDSSFAITHDFDATLWLESNNVIYAGGVMLGFGAHFSLTLGGGYGYTQNGSRTVSYTFADDDSWDKYKVTTYLDTRFNTLVFDVDSSASYSSFPYEGNYCRRAVDWQVVSADTLKTGSTNETLEYAVTVSNVSPATTWSTALDPLTFTGEVVNYLHQASVHPTEIDIAKNANGTFTVSLSSADTGSFDGLFRLAVVNPSDGSTDGEDIGLRAVFTSAAVGVYAECSTATRTVAPTSDPVSVTFPITLENIGESSATLETGVSSTSAGVTYQLGTFANPVPAGAQRQVNLTLTCAGDHYPFTATFWCQVQGAAETYRELVLTVDSAGATPIAAAESYTRAARTFDIRRVRGQGLVFTAPGATPATVEVLDISGRLVFAGRFVGILGGAQIESLNRCGIYLCTLRQGSRVMRRQVSVVR
ncbi:MAG: hypothetical protein GF331_14135 [Chitinivibrionales bacterium]|nr:hypothetical protein [Chitinivibrionales bacterium]